MNTKQIIAELRRSACEDDDPWEGCNANAFSVVHDMTGHAYWFYANDQENDIRTFYLLVAEAMEST
jgi:hypothetical protein